MNILVVGSGGREHAICHAVARSKRLGKLFTLPGNAGTATLGTNVGGDPCDFGHVLSVIRREAIDLTIVGPEDPLAAGLVDALHEAGVRVFGPTASAARLEADKAYAKQLMRQYAVPTAEARTFSDYEHARQYIATRDEALVVKAAGLAKGKGAIVCDDPSDALMAAERMLKKREFGEAGAKIVVEEKLLGWEASLLALVNGQTMYILDPAQDYKRLGDGGTGPNTGGMGSYCPSTGIDEHTMLEIQRQIMVPIADALHREEVPFVGVLYAGLMLTASGPKVLEFNCRFGDPETQVILPRLRSDFLDLIEAVVDGALDEVDVAWDERAAVCVVMASGGYPGKYSTGVPIDGLPVWSNEGDVFVYHAGTKLDGDRVVTAGGRVLGVTGLGETLASARQRAYEAAEGIAFEGAIYRRDIAG